jgi:hypothetical protein
VVAAVKVNSPKEDRMQNPFLRLFPKGDLEKSADLVDQLQRHQKTWPAIQTKYFELDKRCCQLSEQFMAAKNCGSPTAVTLHQELTAACSARDRGPGWFTVEQNRLRCQIEALTAPAIRAFLEQCQVWMRQAHQARRVNVLERTFDPVTEKQLARISSNTGTVQQAKDYIKAAHSEVQSLQHRPLEEIHAKIAEVTANVEKFDFDKLESDDEWVSASLIQDFMAESVAPANAVYDTAYLAPAGKATGGYAVVRVEKNN